MSATEAPPDDALLAEIERRAADMARGAGEILSGYFGQARSLLEVSYKDKNERDPVSKADTESQEFLRQAISNHFPDHTILGEEDADEEQATPANDFVWILDPLDGTKNFLGGLPLYACSIGVLHRGVPLVGALFVPWPGEDGGTVLHARKGGGAFAGQERIAVFDSDQPGPNMLVTLPGSFRGSYRFDKAMRGKVGEVRTLGSIAYELALTARGVLQYSVITGSHLWDVAGGVVLVTEAGGLAMRGRQRRGPGSFFRPVSWESAKTLVRSWRSGETTTADLRRWSGRLVLGSPRIVQYVTSSMRSRSRRGRGIARLLRRHRH